ncbi:MAG: hypothetical protein GF311_27225 [Candidatus Lokiarchaeota archaeon]|nr:hypothetical protein [Candidatus Lokiarchaeota archaeon]
MENYDEDVLNTKKYFVAFMKALNADFERYESKGNIGDLLVIWMHTFFEYELATHSNPIFHSFCENIFRLTNDPFPGSAISEIYSEYVKYSGKRQNRKELIRFLLQRLTKIQPFYMMELIDSILYYVLGEGCWEVFDDDALKFLTDAIRKAELIETAYEGLLVFAQVLNTLITAPIFSKISENLAEILHKFIINLSERKSMNKRIPSELDNIIAQMPTSSQKAFKAIPGIS